MTSLGISIDWLGIHDQYTACTLSIMYTAPALSLEITCQCRRAPKLRRMGLALNRSTKAIMMKISTSSVEDEPQRDRDTSAEKKRNLFCKEKLYQS